MTTTATMIVGQFGRPTLSKDGRTMTVRIPITLRHQGGRKQVVTPADAIPGPTALTRRQHHRQGHRPRPSLARHAGIRRHATVRDLAKAEAINESYLGRVLRLTLLSPRSSKPFWKEASRQVWSLTIFLDNFPLSWASNSQKTDRGSVNIAAVSDRSDDKILSGRPYNL